MEIEGSMETIWARLQSRPQQRVTSPTEGTDTRPDTREEDIEMVADMIL